jgi:hypothetical protein
MKKEDRRTIIRLTYSSVWWVTFILALMMETSGGRWYALASTIIYIIVLFSDAKAESLEEQRKKDRKRLAAKFEKEMAAVRESYRYSGRTIR